MLYNSNPRTKKTTKYDTLLFRANGNQTFRFIYKEKSLLPTYQEIWNKSNSQTFTTTKFKKIASNFLKFYRPVVSDVYSDYIFFPSDSLCRNIN